MHADTAYSESNVRCCYVHSDVNNLLSFYGYSLRAWTDGHDVMGGVERANAVSNTYVIVIHLAWDLNNCRLNAI